jgi:protein involved in polysaccharide export with SLBB domain
MHIIKKVLLFIIPFAFWGINNCGAQNRAVISKKDSINTQIQMQPGNMPLPSGNLSQKVGVDPIVIPSNSRETQENDYKFYDIKPSSDVFGAEFFNSASLSFEPNLRIGTPANYILGPDDELVITVSGYQETNIRTTVQPEGNIFIPQVGNINVSGLNIETAISRIKDRMAQTAYPSLRTNLSKLVISLGKIRSIHITIIGAVKSGNYTVSSLSTVFNSLYLCGGPGSINTYRDIELIRNDKVYEKIDIYQFLRRGNQKGNILLKEGDVINFPVYKKHVNLEGEVKRPGTFELKENETFNDLLFFAGGYTEKAYKASIKVKQITDIERRVRDFSKTEMLTYVPSNGDSMQVDAVLNRFENAVKIFGAVYRPGEFELTPGLTIGGLIRRAGGLLENVYTDRATVTRTHTDGTTENITFNVASVMNGSVADISLVKRDIISIATLNQFKNAYKVTIEGEVKAPGDYSYSDNLSLKDLFFKAQGFTDAASSYNIEVSRRIIGERLKMNIDSIAIVYTLNTNKNLNIENDKFILSPYDVVTVRRNPGYIEQQRVSIVGEVNYPGAYTIQSKKERVSDIIARAGGLTPLAYSKGIYLIRHDAHSDIKASQQAIAKNVQNAIKDSSTKVIEDIARSNSRIPISLKKILEDPTSVQNYIVLNEDSIEVLKVDPLIKISGEVLVATKTGFIEGKGLKYYLNQAGGTNFKSRRSKIYVLYPDGHVRKTWNGFLGIARSYPKIEEGAEIIVPRKPNSKSVSITEIVGVASSVISVITLTVLTITTLRK